MLGEVATRACAAVALFLACSTCPAFSADRRVRSSRDTTLAAHLRLLGRLHDVFFTIEEAWGEGQASNHLSGRVRTFPSPSDSATLEDDLTALKAMIPETRTMPSPGNARIVHVMDARLFGLDSYSMNEEIGDVDFEGSPTELLESVLMPQVPGIARVNMISLQPDPFYATDELTHIRVAVQRGSVRGMLSNHLPLDDYSRVLWVASTKLTSPPATQVRFGRLREWRSLARARSPASEETGHDRKRLRAPAPDRELPAQRGQPAMRVVLLAVATGVIVAAVLWRLRTRGMSRRP